MTEHEASHLPGPELPVEASHLPGPELPVEVALPHGEVLVVRSVAPDDVEAITQLYGRLNSDDRYRRFFSHFGVRPHWVAGWVERCRTGGLGLVAVAPHGVIVGEAAYVLLANGNGEFSLTVDHDWRGWLGPYLLDLLVDSAAARGVPNLEAEILTENRPMRALVRRRNAVVVGDSEGAVQHVVIGTHARQATWPPAGAGPRLLVEAPGMWRPAADATRAGWSVLGCAGPDHRAVGTCPMREGAPCPLAAAADAIVVAMPPDSEAGRWLVEAHGRIHPGVPLLVVGGDEREDGCRIAVGSPANEVVDRLDALVQRSDDDGP